MPLVLHARVVSGTGGGPDKTILNSPRFLRDAGYPMLCAYLRDPRDPHFEVLANSAKTWGAEILPVDDFGPFDWRVVQRLRALCEKHRPAIWHGHDYKTNLLGLLLRRSHPMHLVTTVHGWVKNTWKTPLYYAIDRQALRRYEQVVCVSQDLYERCLGLGVAEKRCWHIPNAIDTEEYRRTGPARGASLRRTTDPGRFVIGAMGRLSAEKGFDLLIRAVARLLDEGLDVELWIAGEGDQQAALSSTIASLGLQERIRLPGFCANPLEFFAALDAFALSSLREGLPNVLLEAMAFELPVVSTRVAGIPKLITDGENGLLVDAGSVDALASGLRRLITDGKLGRQLGEAGRQTVETAHSFRRRMDKIKQVYDTALRTAATASSHRAS